MNDSDQWIIVDTETTGIRNPVWPVEIAAQTMTGWKPTGTRFRVLLNFDAPIEPFAEDLHGYSQPYLRQNGLEPTVGIGMLLQYAGGCPVVSYNLAFDGSRVLEPTLERIGVTSKIRLGFCALGLARNTIWGLPNYKLETVAKTLGIVSEQTHHAGDDVEIVVRLLSNHLAPHFRQLGISGFASIAACATGHTSVPPINAARAKSMTKAPRKKALSREELFRVGELVGICRAIILDKRLSADEVNFLAHWLENCPQVGAEPIARMYDTVRAIVADGKVTPEEQKLLSSAIDEVLAWHP